VEDKDHALTVHYRGAPQAEALCAQRMIRGIVASVGGSLEVRRGKCCSEVVPAVLEDKGAAVKRLLAPLRGRALPVYVGDDQNDEPAFAALADGVTVRVAGGACLTRARYHLSGAGEVREFLQRMAHVEDLPRSGDLACSRPSGGLQTPPHLSRLRPDLAAPQGRRSLEMT
jgi:trehalose-phosphatase